MDLSTNTPVTHPTATQIHNHTVLMTSRVLFVIVAVVSIVVKLMLLPTEINVYRDLTTQVTISPLWATVYVWGLTLFYLVLCIIFITVGLLIFWRMSNDRIGILVAIWLVTFGVGGVSFEDAVTIENYITSPLVYNVFFALTGLTWFMFLPFMVLFPDGRVVPRWAWLPLIVGLIMPLFWIFPRDTPFYAPNWSPLIWLVVSCIAFGLPLLAQIQRYRLYSTPTQRQQTKFVVYGFAVIIIGVILSALLQVQFPNAFKIDTFGAPFLNILIDGVMVAIPISMGIAMFRYRLWNIDVVINRSLVYGTLTVGAVAIFFGIAALLQIVVGEQQPLIALLMSGVIAALAFQPVRKRVEEFVDKRIYGLRFNLDELNAAHKPHEITNPGSLTGQVLDGYQVLGIIGQGGMGEIYEGLANGQKVAIKTMLPRVANDMEMRKRFMREAEAGMQLDHPNIAKVYTHGDCDGTPYLIMDYIEGQDLSHCMKADGRMDTATAIRLMCDICAALASAHAKGFVHRDLKPSNIMIRPNGDAVLMDFGITKMTDASTSLTGTGAIGTIDYMAPEQIMSAREVDHRADVYALGVMLYEMLTGEKPFAGGAAQIMFAHLHQPAPDPRDSNDDIPRHLARAIMQAMAKQPHERFENVAAFASAISG